MVSISIPSDDLVINALNHEIRRDILQLLRKQPMSYSQLLDHFTISSGKLNYHLKLLTGFVQKRSDGLYENTALGEKIFILLLQFRGTISETERPLLKEAYISQRKGNKSYLQLKLIGSIYLKLILIISVLAVIVVMTILYALAGVSLEFLLPLYAVLIPIIIVAVIWTLRLRRPAKEFADRVDRFLDSDEEE